MGIMFYVTMAVILIVLVILMVLTILSYCAGYDKLYKEVQMETPDKTQPISIDNVNQKC